MFYLICFDIVDDRDRTRVGKIIGNHGRRVQKSVFECSDLSEEQILKLKTAIDDQIDDNSDSVRYYPMCRSCLNKLEFSGTGRKPIMKKFHVV